MKKFLLTLVFCILGVTSVFGATGKIIDGRTMVPVRGVFEELGFKVVWDGTRGSAMIEDDIYEVRLSRNEKTFTVNGKVVVPEVPQQIIDGSFYLPLKAVGDSIGAAVSWDNNTKTAHISYLGKDSYVSCSPKASAQSSNSSMTYPGFPNVPDLGKVNNIECRMSINDGESMMYAYDGDKVTPEMLENLKQVLLKEGFVQIPIDDEPNITQVAWSNMTDTSVVIGADSSTHEIYVGLIRLGE